MLIDSHAHLDMKDFDKDRNQVIERAIKADITHILTIGIDLHSSMKALRLAEEYGFIFSSILRLSAQLFPARAAGYQNQQRQSAARCPGAISG